MHIYLEPSSRTNLELEQCNGQVKNITCTTTYDTQVQQLIRAKDSSQIRLQQTISQPHSDREDQRS